VSVLAKKSWRDTRRRWARSVFTVVTIAAAVASVSLFALPGLVGHAALQQVKEDRLHDIEFSVRDTVLSPQELASLRSLSGVSALDVRTTYNTRLRVGDRRDDVMLVGVSDWAHQGVNVVGIASGAAPGAGQALSDSQNARSGRLSGGAGTPIGVEDNAGTVHALTLSGQGSTLEFAQVATSDRAVLYTAQSTVAAIAGAKGINTIDVRVGDPATVQTVVQELRGWFATNRPDVAFDDLPDVRAAGTWPGQDQTNNFSKLFYVGAVLALLSATALVSNTVTTMVAEQRREIAVMKAIGARPRQVMASFLRMVLILAGMGTVLGIAIGIPASNLLAGFIGRQFMGIDPTWSVSWLVIGIGTAVGMLLTPLAAIPALLRAGRMTVRDGLTAGIAQPGGSWLTSLLRRVPLPRAAQVGLGNVARRPARALGTGVQAGLAVGVALGFLALGATVTHVTAHSYDADQWDITVSQRSNTALDPQAGTILASLPGVKQSHPVLYNNVNINGTAYEAWGLPVDSKLYVPDLEAGRWFGPADSAEPVVVIGHALAAKTGLAVGDTVAAGTARGDVTLTIIGIDRRLTNNSTGVFLPLQTLQRALGRTDSNAYWLVSSDRNASAVDELAGRAEDTLGSAGYPVSTNITSVERAANIASNRTLVAVLAVMGIPIVIIGLIGLVNMMTMNVIERTREVGMLRCIGAASGDIKRIFRAEALAVALFGWLLAVPLGWLIGWTLVQFVIHLFSFPSLPYSYPLLYPAVGLFATVALAWLVIVAPLRRASDLKPGDALRYE
jgi:putative ABC transport system permease protein